MPEIAPRPLSSLTTLRTGGEPARMWEAHDRDELVAALRDTWASGEPWFVLGGGSNLFVGDEPFEGTVIRILTRGIERLPAPAPQVARLRVQAGHDWDDLVAYTVAEGLSGIAAMSGIPGTVGAAPVQNVGAYGQEIVQTLVEVELIDESTGEVSTVPAAELGLGFRTSVLKHHHGSEPLRRAVILSVTLDLLEVGPAPRRLRGAQLRQALGLEQEFIEGVTVGLFGHRPQQHRTDDLGPADAEVDRQVAVFMHGRQQHRFGPFQHSGGQLALADQFGRVQRGLDGRDGPGGFNHGVHGGACSRRIG
ncbi:MAG: FAD-binding protein [Micrococcales bacterium]|nr:FAD-binding protein [Micrococcales bacterium]